MSKTQRTKGAQFEREVCAIFSSALGQEFKRNIGQARDGGNDIDIGPLVVECKRRKTLGTVYGWLQQAIVACTGEHRRRVYNETPGGSLLYEGDTELVPRIPVVVARQDADKAPIVILRLSDFLILTRDELVASLPAE